MDMHGTLLWILSIERKKTKMAFFTSFLSWLKSIPEPLRYKLFKHRKMLQLGKWKIKCFSQLRWISLPSFRFMAWQETLIPSALGVQALVGDWLCEEYTPYELSCRMGLLQIIEVRRHFILSYLCRWEHQEVLGIWTFLSQPSAGSGSTFFFEIHIP